MIFYFSCSGLRRWSVESFRRTERNPDFLFSFFYVQGLKEPDGNVVDQFTNRVTGVSREELEKHRRKRHA